MKRQIYGLRWAKRLEAKPRCIPTGRARGVKAFGVRYEKEVGRSLPSAEPGVWFEFEDRNGPGYCQTDFLISTRGKLVILESKYTWGEWAHEELETLYSPVVEAALGSKAKTVVVCKNLTPQTKVAIFPTLDECIIHSAPRVVWHFIGGKVHQPQLAGFLSPAEIALGLDGIV